MTTPVELGRELGIDAQVLRRWLRATYPRTEPGQRWELSPDQVGAARERWATPTPTRTSLPRPPRSRPGASRATSDEAYVIELLDEILGASSQRQHRFEWLRGDPGQSSRRARLPVDAFWPDLRLVAEYRERQHRESTPFFDKPTVMTISGVDRGEQRRRYDARREDLIPKHGLRLLVVNADQLSCNPRGRLRRERRADLKVLTTLVLELGVSTV